MHIPEVLAPLLKPKQFKVVYGGRGGGKSVTIADILLMRVMTEGIKVSAMRELMNSITDSCHSLFTMEIARLELEGFDIQATSIYHKGGGEIQYKGLSRNPEAIKSMAGFDVFWLEEASTVSKRSLDLVIPTLREEGAELWLSFNPSSRGDPVSKEFIAPYRSQLLSNGTYEDELHTIIKCNYYDNPFFPETLDKLRLKHKETKTKEEYLHIWEGEELDTVDRAIIKKEWFDAAIDAHIKLGIDPKGATIATHDPADGGDSYGYACRTGILYTDIDELEAANGNDACDEATDRAIKANADLFVYDADGMGALLRNQIADSFEGIKCEIRPYNGSMSVDDPDKVYGGLSSLGTKDKPKTNAQSLKNKRAQFFMKLANKFYQTYLAVEQGKYIDPDTIISISSEIKLIDKLRAECCRIPTVPNGAGKIQLMDKKTMKKQLDLDSPGMADCLAMGEELPEPNRNKAPVRMTFRRAV